MLEVESILCLLGAGGRGGGAGGKGGGRGQGERGGEGTRERGAGAEAGGSLCQLCVKVNMCIKTKIIP